MKPNRKALRWGDKNKRPTSPRAVLVLLTGFWCVTNCPGSSEALAGTTQETAVAELTSELCILSLPRSVAAKEGSEGIKADLAARIKAANRRSTEEWRAISSRGQWEPLVEEKLALLQDSLGSFPEVTGKPASHQASTLEGDRFRIHNLVFESRPGFWVTANLYLPEPVRDSMPGLLLCHSHHNPKTQGELQDMGMTWARLGCAVLVMDQFGHGERRQHPFLSADDYPGEFRPGRQDYYFRYYEGIQLHLAGESLMGWMVWDIIRGIDLLLSQRGVDPSRLAILGSVAGGGDPAAVAAALDESIDLAVPFNFGGPQPETLYPLSDDAEDAFNYMGAGSWESTRNLRLSGRDGFLPWVIVASIAPRTLVYAHEFSWDQARDPVWRRLQRVFGDFYGRPEHLDFSHGFGTLRERPPQASHCNNIGPEHRKRIHQALQQRFGIPSSPEHEFQDRRPEEALLCMTPELRQRLQLQRPFRSLINEIYRSRIRALRNELQDLSSTDGLLTLRSLWAGRLGDIEPAGPPVVLQSVTAEVAGGFRAEQTDLEVEPGITVPLLLLYPEARSPTGLVIGISHAGRATFLAERTDVIAGLLTDGFALCLPDLRGTGETALGRDRGRTSADTAFSSSELMLGQTMLGSRLRDLRSTLRYLTEHAKVGGTKMVVWGDSFAAVNSPNRDLRVPLDASDQPALSEPLGGILALLTALFEPISGVYVRGGLVSYASVLRDPFVYLPHDAVIPGVAETGDLPLLAASLAPRPLFMEALVDGLNRTVDEDRARREFEVVRQAYSSAPERFHLKANGEGLELRSWVKEALGRPSRLPERAQR